jgi:hypothetical protein
MVHKGEVATKLIRRIGITPAIKNINSLGVNAQIPENGVFKEFKGKENQSTSNGY